MPGLNPSRPVRSFSSSQGGELPPTTVAEPLDDPFLVSALRNLGKKPADRVMQRLMGKDVDEDLPPRDRRRKDVHLPEMDCRRTPVLADVRVHRTESDSEAQEFSPFGPRHDLEFPSWNLGLSEIEDPRDSSVL